MKKIRVWYKKLISRFMLVDSFCRVCGTDVRDFIASDELWHKVMGTSNQVVCYNCFCDKTPNGYYKIIEVSESDGNI